MALTEQHNENIVMGWFSGCIFVLFCILGLSYGQIVPSNVLDVFGNNADNESHIIWGTPPKGRLYASGTTDASASADPGQLDGIIVMANKFVDIVTPKMLDYGELRSMCNFF